VICGGGLSVQREAQAFQQALELRVRAKYRVRAVQRLGGRDADVGHRHGAKLMAQAYGAKFPQRGACGEAWWESLELPTEIYTRAVRQGRNDSTFPRNPPHAASCTPVRMELVQKSKRFG
jgi:hypothetical protein